MAQGDEIPEQEDIGLAALQVGHRGIAVNQPALSGQLGKGLQRRLQAHLVAAQCDGGRQHIGAGLGRAADAADLHRVADGLDNEALEAAPIPACIGGRMMLKRVMGKACFATLQDGSAKGTDRIQLYITLDNVGAEKLAAFKHWDLGDILGAEGTLFKTKTG